MLDRLEKIKKFVKNEKDIRGILNTMRNIEKKEGSNSLKLISLNNLLKDFLIEEEKIINSFSSDQTFLVNYLAKENLTLVDEIEASFWDENTLIQYRLFKLMKDSLNDFDLIKIDTFLQLMPKNIDLKYDLCFANPILMNLLVANDFNHERTNIDKYKDKNYEIKKLSFLIRKCADFIIFMVNNEKVNDPICLTYLELIKSSIDDDNFNNICSILTKSGYEITNIKQIFANLKEKTCKKLD